MVKGFNNFDKLWIPQWGADDFKAFKSYNGFARTLKVPCVLEPKPIPPPLFYTFTSDTHDFLNSQLTLSPEVSKFPKADARPGWGEVGWGRVGQRWVLSIQGRKFTISWTQWFLNLGKSWMYYNWRLVKNEFTYLLDTPGTTAMKIYRNVSCSLQVAPLRSLRGSPWLTLGHRAHASVPQVNRPWHISTHSHPAVYKPNHFGLLLEKIITNMLHILNIPFLCAFYNKCSRTSLMVQWLRIWLPM